jgi:hypothetical protein
VSRFARHAVLCQVCAHADRTGSWADLIVGMTHCRGCHATWALRSEFQHCIGCHTTFTNWRAADAHRGPAGCQPPGTVRDRRGRNRLALSTRGLRAGSTVTLWALADHRPQPDQTYGAAPQAPEPADAG